MTEITLEYVSIGGTGELIIQLREQGSSNVDRKSLPESYIAQLLDLAFILTTEGKSSPSAQDRHFVENDEFDIFEKEQLDDFGEPIEGVEPIFVLRLKNGLSFFNDYEMDQAGFDNFIEQLIPIREELGASNGPHEPPTIPPVGPTGPAGPAGPQGPQGPAGGSSRDVFDGEVTTEDNTPTLILSVAIPDTTANYALIFIVANEEGGANRASFERRATLYRGVATSPASFEGVITVIGMDQKSDPSWDIDIDVDETNLVIRAIGPASSTVRWLARVELVTVNEP
jgi:hypothetical protein